LASVTLFVDTSAFLAVATTDDRYHEDANNL
jgi:predicted nucleic acid-binding protein